MNNYIIFAGNPDKGTTWQTYPDTEEGRKQAVAAGCTAISTMSFAYTPEEGKEQPNRRGDLVLDLDCKETPFNSVLAAQVFLKKLSIDYGLDLADLRYWLSGRKGCHIVIPAACYGGEEGDPHLPRIHKIMLTFMCRKRFKDNLRMEKYLDMNLYSTGRGHLLRLENIQRPDERYKVPMTADEFFALSEEKFAELPKQPRTVATKPAETIYQSPGLTNLYCLCKEMVNNTFNKKFQDFKLDHLFGCEFIAHCHSEQETLSEPEWHALIKNLMCYGDVGRKLVHEFSCGYPAYSYEETEKKIEHAAKLTAPITCAHICSELNFECEKRRAGSCTAACPAHRWRGGYQREADNKERFILQEDGVYLAKDGVKIASWIKVLSKVRTPDSESWGRLVEILRSDGTRARIYLRMVDISVRGGEPMKGVLLNAGAEIEMFPKAVPLLQDYLVKGISALPHGLLVEKLGWIDENGYFLPDQQFGHIEQECFLKDDPDPIHASRGTLEEWKGAVGKYCQGNSLLVFATSFALTGPLLKPLSMEGSGMHIYGGSSQGKTTVAFIAGSVCGGGGGRGFVRQWRATHNALETIATMHNDNLLVLDEIGQANSETINHVSYMLANGQGKERMKSNSSRRKALTWLVNFLSTGEVTINDKIEEDGRNRFLAGQSVRIIDLPVDEGEDKNPFRKLHGLESEKAFSDIVKGAAAEYYGTPLRTFLEKLCSAKDETIDRLRTEIEAYEHEWCPEGAGSQVQRVLKKFAMIGATGELAIEWDIFPYKKGEAQKAAKQWFDIWINSRKGVENLEIQKAMQRIQEFIESCEVREDYGYKHPRLFNRLDQGPLGEVGYADGDDYFIYDTVWSRLRRGIDERSLLNKLAEHGWIGLTRGGNPIEKREAYGPRRGKVFKVKVIRAA